LIASLNKPVRSISAVNFKLFVNLSEFWAVRQEVAPDVKLPFMDRSMSRIDQLFASRECSFVRELKSNNGGADAALSRERKINPATVLQPSSAST
jgi:hypothetical protein